MVDAEGLEGKGDPPAMIDLSLINFIAFADRVVVWSASSGTDDQ